MKNATLSGNAPRMNGIARFVELKRNKIIEVISALFILLFLYTALSKSFDIESTAKVIEKVPFITLDSAIVAWAVVFTEYIISLLLFVPYTRKIGLYSSLILMIVFTGYISYMQLFVPKLPCSCGGVISLMTWTEHLLFNLVFILLAFLALILLRNKRKQGAGDIETTQVIFT